MRHLPLLLWIAASSAIADDWSQWRGPERTGVAKTTAPSAWPERLEKRWQVFVGIGHSSPVVSGGRAFQFSRDGEREVLRALALEDGRTVWQQSYDAPYRMNPAATGHGKGPKSTPLLAGGRVFTLGIEGMLSCHDASTGALLWRNDFRERFPETSPAFGTAMSPMMAKEKLLVHLGGPSRGAILALEPGTGEPLWGNDVDGPGSASPIVATLAGIEAVVTQTERFFVAVSLETGDTLFRLPFTTPYDQNIVTPIALGNRLVFAGLDSPTFAVELARDGTKLRPSELWRSPVSFYMSTPVALEDRLIGMSNRRRGQFVALDSSSGAVLWESEGRVGEHASLVRLGNWILALTDSGELFVLPADASSFAPLQRYRVAESPTWAHPVPASGGILVKDESTLAFWSYEGEGSR